MAVTEVGDPRPATGPAVLTVDDRPSLVRRGSERTPRDPWFDNARLVAVVLVVLGHCMLAVNDGAWLYPAWAALWPFRIPALVVLAGLFSSDLPLTRSRLLVLARDLLLVFVLFSVIVSVQTRVNGEVADTALVPEYGLWFLLSLFCWRVTLPLVARVPHLGAWAVGAALLAGFLPVLGATLSLSRTVVLFPLFVLGWRLRSVDLHARPERRLRVVALVAALALVVVVLVLYRSSVLHYVDFRMQDTYTGDALDRARGVLTRLALLGAGALGALTLVALVPRRRVRFWTYLGAGSMFIYLLHIVAMKLLIGAGWFELVRTPADAVLMLAAAVGVALALASPPVRRVTRPLVQPRTLRGRSARRVRL